MPKSRAYQDELTVYLQDPQRAIAYLNGALEEGDPDFFLSALKNVARARGVKVTAKPVEEASSELLMTFLNELGLGLTTQETSSQAA